MKAKDFRNKYGKKRERKTKTKSKYNNSKTVVDGIKFDSIKEAKRYKELKLMEDNGYIKNLELQPRFELTPTQKWNGKTLRKMSYVADFMYEDLTGDVIVEDTKGFRTDTYICKMKMFLYRYGKQLEFKEI